jgi:site-specific DNA-methyltransferase (adenine-specific)
VFHDEPVGGKTKNIIISVKSGHVSVKDVRDLRGVIEREHAEIGVLITLETPTKPMEKETTEAGFYVSPWGRHPRLQILTIAELLSGEKRLNYPQAQGINVTYKQAARVKPETNATNLPLPLDDSAS